MPGSIRIRLLYFDLILTINISLGVPALWFKRGLADDIVISPYSSILALNSDPGDSLYIRKLIELGMEGKYGLYEAVDFTQRRRVSLESKYQIVKSLWLIIKV